MILSCLRLHEPVPDPMNPKWLVEISEGTDPQDIYRLCGVIPKLYGAHPDKTASNTGWGSELRRMIENSECYALAYSPANHGGRGMFIVTARFREKPTAVEDNDEPRFPPYSGPVGKQADGSFVLSPRLFHYLKEAWMWRGRDRMPPIMAQTHFDEFCKKLEEETGEAQEQLT